MGCRCRGRCRRHGAIAQFVPLILIFVVFYFLLIRPQQKKAKEHQNYLANLKKGDKVITGGGIHGQITGMTDNGRDPGDRRECAHQGQSRRHCRFRR
jgi:preprotein translocase YajC subunit